MSDDDAPIRIGTTSDTFDTFDPPHPEEVANVSALEGLRKALQAPVETEPTLIRVPARPGVMIRCHTRMIQEDRKAWMARSTKKSRRGGGTDEVDDMKFSCLVLANTCEAVLFDGVAAHHEDDTPLTFRSRVLWDMVGASDPEAAIRALFGVDAHVLIASGEVLLASGFDDDLQATDPTTAS